MKHSEGHGGVPSTGMPGKIVVELTVGTLGGTVVDAPLIFRLDALLYSA